MDILRFITAGSVDDGKSTLIGRLLYDSKNILIDQLEAIERSSVNSTNGQVDLALLTDGLRAEREQGITIDVAYRYFSTPKRKFIIADAPGHVQYTRNLVTGASNVNLMIVLIDARQGIIEQTKRHSIIASLFEIQHIVVAINKMDLVNYAEDVYKNIVHEYTDLAKSLGLKEVKYIPISALNGDNVVEPSTQMEWYDGKCLLDYLETIEVTHDINLEDARFPVQYVIRPQTKELHDYRGYAGKISSGIYKTGDTVTVLPSGNTSKIKTIEIGGIEVAEAYAPQSIVMQLENDIDISRGDLISKSDNQPSISNEFEILLCWMDAKPPREGATYYFQLNSRIIRAVIKNIEYRLNVNTLNREDNPSQPGLNDILKVTLKTASQMPYDSYSKMKTNGGGILIDETSNSTVAACLIL